MQSYLSGRTPIGTGQSTTGSTFHELTKVYGAETTKLTAPNIPPHTHAATFQPTTGPVPINIPATSGRSDAISNPIYCN